jgi:FkbM family methyltransferase
MPAQGTQLYAERNGEPWPVCVRCDSWMGAYIAVEHRWEEEKTMFFTEVQRKFADSGRVTLIDIGANVGLFARSCVTRATSRVNLYCYEPDQINHSLLRRNLGFTSDKNLKQAAITIHPGMIKLHIDASNTGNHSLNKNSLAESAENYQYVQGLSIVEESHIWTQHSGYIFFKADTQGYDEMIVASASEELWEKTKAGVMEIRRIAGKNYDEDRFAKMLDKYPNKVTDKKPGINLTTKSIIEFAKGPSDYRDVDILFWK